VPVRLGNDKIYKDIASDGSQRGIVGTSRIHLSKYDAELAEHARNLSLLGYTNDDIAGVFGIDTKTLLKWMDRYPEFRKAIWEGRDVADGKVAASLFMSATGYSVRQYRHFVVNGEVVEVPYIQNYPPNNGAAALILSNRQKARWRARPEVDASDIDPRSLAEKIRDAQREMERLTLAPADAADHSNIE